MNDWYLEWEMCGMQWDVLRIDLFENKLSESRGLIAPYHECFKFIYTNLLLKRYAYFKPDIFMHCSEGTFKLTEQDITAVLVNYCPEELI